MANHADLEESQSEPYLISWNLLISRENSSEIEVEPHPRCSPGTHVSRGNEKIQKETEKVYDKPEQTSPFLVRVDKVNALNLST